MSENHMKVREKRQRSQTWINRGETQTQIPDLKIERSEGRNSNLVLKFISRISLQTFLSCQIPNKRNVYINRNGSLDQGLGRKQVGLGDSLRRSKYNSSQMPSIAPKRLPLRLPQQQSIPIVPLELQIQILKQLDWKEQCRLSSVCKTWRSIITEWVIPSDFNSKDVILGPQILNPALKKRRYELGSCIQQATGNDDLSEQQVEFLAKPLCWPYTQRLKVRVVDERKDGLEPVVDSTVIITPQIKRSSPLTIYDLFACLDNFYNELDDDRVITDTSNFQSWKFRQETNHFWRRGYVHLTGKWEWRLDGDILYMYARAA